jgi:magnesium transporter
MTPVIRGYVNENGRMHVSGSEPAELARATWIDMLSPSDSERAMVEGCLGIAIPTREDMQEIEASSRLYHEDGAAFMTATIPARTEGDSTEMAPVTFILYDNRLVTLRYHEPRAFQTFAARVEKGAHGLETGDAVTVALLEAVVDRLADLLERIGPEIDKLSQEVFRRGAGQQRDLQHVVSDIGRKGDLTSNMHSALVSLDRLVGFLAQVTATNAGRKELRARVKTLSRDTRSLIDHSSFLSHKINFVLDATLGMINIEQNSIIKIFSVMAVVFLPPTLIASIYGMNFEYMPELGWPLGYPFALVLMVLSAIGPYLYFKRRGWL